jgi:hypothetical protein
MPTVSRLIIAPLALFAALQCTPAPAWAQSCDFCVYSVKFICGAQGSDPNLFLPSEPPVKPGNYATAINIHNFHMGPEQQVTLMKSAVIAYPENQQQDQVSPGPQSVTLKPGHALEIDCPDIVSLLPTGPPAFIKGFVDLRGTSTAPLPPLSVTAVYTAQATTIPDAQPGPVSIEVVPVQPLPGP